MKYLKKKKTKFYRFLSRHPVWYHLFYAIWPKGKRHRLRQHVFGNPVTTPNTNSHYALVPKAEEIYRKLKLFEGEK